jgi:3-hydroxybutyryl-CoA dehydrogenase
VSAGLATSAAGLAAAVKKVAVVGGGTMGNGIAQVFATHGFDVALIDMRQEFVERALNTIGKSLDRVAKKQSWVPEQVQGIIQRIRGGVARKLL